MSMNHWCGWLCSAWVLLAGTMAHAQQPFVFSVATGATERPRSVVYDTGFGERPFDVSADAGRLEQRIGLQASLGRRMMLLAHVGVSPDEQDTRVSQRAELVMTLRDRGPGSLSFAAGGGMRHESAGVNVLIGRVATGRSVRGSRLQANIVFEKPLSAGRDRIDLITSAGWTRPITRAWWLGIEGIGEDLEGFWDAAEAEGGARLLLGPSVRVAPPGRRWQVALTGGPVLRATNSTGTSGAERVLPRQAARTGFAVRTALTYGF